jgi:hypothetical protein
MQGIKQTILRAPLALGYCMISLLAVGGAVRVVWDFGRFCERRRRTGRSCIPEKYRRLIRTIQEEPKP